MNGVSQAMRASVMGSVVWGVSACSPAPPTPVPPAVCATSEAFAIAHAALQGDRSAFEPAERALFERLRSDPDDVTTRRFLARFLNHRASEGDFSRASEQAALYRGLLSDQPDAGRPLKDLSQTSYVYAAFASMADAGAAADAHRPLAALRQVRSVESSMQARLATRSLDVELHAMAGTYALNLAEFVGLRRRSRRLRAADAFAVQQAHWSRQSPMARGLGVAPGTRTVFAAWLAQLYAQLGREHEARTEYRRVANLADDPQATTPMRQLGAFARARLQGDPQTPTDRIEPSGRESCIACHSDDATLRRLPRH